MWMTYITGTKYDCYGWGGRMIKKYTRKESAREYMCSRMRMLAAYHVSVETKISPFTIELLKPLFPRHNGCTLGMVGACCIIVWYKKDIRLRIIWYISHILHFYATKYMYTRTCVHRRVLYTLTCLLNNGEQVFIGMVSTSQSIYFNIAVYILQILHHE